MNIGARKEGGGRVEAHLYKKNLFRFPQILIPVFASADIMLSDSFHVFSKNLTHLVLPEIYFWFLKNFPVVNV